jgi:hypothetical protein
VVAVVPGSLFSWIKKAYYILIEHSIEMMKQQGYLNRGGNTPEQSELVKYKEVL